MKKHRIREALKIIGEIFVPLLPGIICAGMCGAAATLISQMVPNYADRSIWAFAYGILTLINRSAATFLTAWAGYRAAERFGGTPILGGMLGLITSLDGINEIAGILGLYNSEIPLDSILCSGKGGVLAVVAGALMIACAEKAIRAFMPDSIAAFAVRTLAFVATFIPKKPARIEQQAPSRKQSPVPQPIKNPIRYSLNRSACCIPPPFFAPENWVI